MCIQKVDFTIPAVKYIGVDASVLRSFCSRVILHKNQLILLSKGLGLSLHSLQMNIVAFVFREIDGCIIKQVVTLARLIDRVRRKN